VQINIFIPCFIDQLYPDTAINMVKLLRRLGYEIGYNPNQTCCGQPAFNAGFWTEATAVGQKMLADMQALPADTAIICPSASCTGFIKNTLPKLLEKTEISLNINELATFLAEQIGLKRLAEVVQPRLVGRAIYHDACAALRECGIKSAPRSLLGLVADLELVEAADAEVCCGFGGTFASKYEPISVAMAQQKVDNALLIKADYIISTDLSCLMQLQSYIDHKGYPIRCLHIVDVLMSV
jgi:L-lactate dehydrogenase complex protein LldE